METSCCHKQQDSYQVDSSCSFLCCISLFVFNYCNQPGCRGLGSQLEEQAGFLGERRKRTLDSDEQKRETSQAPGFGTFG